MGSCVGCYQLVIFFEIFEDSVLRHNTQTHSKSFALCFKVRTPLTYDNSKRFSQTLNVKPFPQKHRFVCPALLSFITSPRNMQAIKCWLLFIASSGHGSSQFSGVVVGDGAVGKVRCSVLFTPTPSQPMLFLDVPLDILYNKCLSRT